VLPPPSSVGLTFSGPRSASEIPRNCAARRTDLLTAGPSISAVNVLSLAIFSGPVDWAWSVPVSKVEADQELAVWPMGDGLEDLSPLRKNLPSNTTYPLIGVACRLPAERPVGRLSGWSMSACRHNRTFWPNAPSDASNLKNPHTSYMNRMAQSLEGGLQKTFALGRVGMNCCGDILKPCAHLQR
jgi:hypothetical protein